MTRLSDHMFTGGLQMMDGDISYHDDNPRQQSPGNVMDIFPNASGFYSQKLNDRLYAGIGLYGNYGLGIDFGNWDGRRLIKKSTMVAMTLSPSLAYQLNNRLSVGGSVNLNYGYLSLTRGVGGHDETEKDHDWAMKPVAIHLFMGQRPVAAFGNSDGDLDILRLIRTIKPLNC